MAEYIDRGRLMERLGASPLFAHFGSVGFFIRKAVLDLIAKQTAADVVEVDKVAEMLRLSFGDDCACNFNGNDEWMWEKCKYAESDCPYPKDELGCWKEFVKHFLAKMDGKGEGE